MPQIAGFRGALWDASRVDLPKVAATTINNAKDLLAASTLVREPTRAMYRYHQVFAQGGRIVTRAMLVAAVRLEPWTDGSIRAHEASDARAVAAELASIESAGGYTAPVLAGFRDAAREVERVLRKTEDEKPALEVATADGTTHRLWRVPSAEVLGKLRTLFAPKKLHVLDGHARYDGMLAYAQKLGADSQPQYSSAKYGLACLVNLEDPTIVVSAVHRIVRGDAVTRDSVLDGAKQFFIVDKLAGGAKDLARQQNALVDTVAHQPAFVVSFAGDPDAWKLTLKPDVSLVRSGAQVHRALQKYDPVVLDEVLLARLATGATITAERDPQAVHAQVAGGAQLGIIVRPLSLEQVIHVDELGARLPAASTAFGPPLANLVAFFVDPDEDLA